MNVSERSITLNHAANETSSQDRESRQTETDTWLITLHWSNQGFMKYFYIGSHKILVPEISTGNNDCWHIAGWIEDNYIVVISSLLNAHPRLLPRLLWSLFRDARIVCLEWAAVKSVDQQRHSKLYNSLIHPNSGATSSYMTRTAAEQLLELRHAVVIITYCGHTCILGRCWWFMGYLTSYWLILCRDLQQCL